MFHTQGRAKGSKVRVTDPKNNSEGVIDLVLQFYPNHFDTKNSETGVSVYMSLEDAGALWRDLGNKIDAAQKMQRTGEGPLGFKPANEMLAGDVEDGPMEKIDSALVSIASEAVEQADGDDGAAFIRTGDQIRADMKAADAEAEAERAHERRMIGE